MGTKMAVAFSNIFMGKVESNSIWSINKDEVTKFIGRANSHHPTLKFTAEVSDTETWFSLATQA